LKINLKTRKRKIFIQFNLKEISLFKVLQTKTKMSHNLGFRQGVNNFFEGLTNSTNPQYAGNQPSQMIPGSQLSAASVYTSQPQWQGGLPSTYTPSTYSPVTSSSPSLVNASPPGVNASPPGVNFWNR
jgi:hypothetical protein